MSSSEHMLRLFNLLFMKESSFRPNTEMAPLSRNMVHGTGAPGRDTRLYSFHFVTVCRAENQSLSLQVSLRILNPKRSMDVLSVSQSPTTDHCSSPMTAADRSGGFLINHQNRPVV